MTVEVVLSYSQLSKHRGCAQAWFYRYEMNLDTPEYLPTPERDFGNWWHALRAADSLLRGRTLKSLKHVPEKIKTVDGGPTWPGEEVSPTIVLEGAGAWWAKQPATYREAFIDKMGEPLQDRLRNLNRKYLARWQKDMEGEVPLAVEMKWERELPGITEGFTVKLVGYIDEVFLLKRRKMIVVRDHKSMKALAASTSLDDMMDSQLQFYAWGAAPIIQEWGVGKLRATAYDRVRSVAPKTPQVTATGLLAKSVTDYDLDTYRRWARGEDGEGVPWGEEGSYYVSGAKKGQPKFGRYVLDEKVVESLDTPVEESKWLQRTLTPLNLTLVQSHLVAAVDTSNGIIESKVRAEERGEAARNLTKNCSWCPYANLCRAQMFGGPKGEYDPADYGLAVIKK